MSPKVKSEVCVALVMFLLMVAACMTVHSLSKPHPVTAETTVTTPPAPIVTPAPPVGVAAAVNRKADGEYLDLLLPCKCGAITVYKPGSCPCFNRDVAPELSEALDGLYACATRMNASKSGGKPVGRYVDLTLVCGCTLKVYEPGSSGCLEKLYPELAAKLKMVYDRAKQREDSSENTQVASSEAIKPCVALLTAEWCEPCKRLEREVIPTLAADGLNVRTVDVDKEPDLANMLFSPQFRSIPQFVLYDPQLIIDGIAKPTQWLIGYHTAAAVEEFATTKPAVTGDATSSQPADQPREANKPLRRLVRRLPPRLSPPRCMGLGSSAAGRKG